MRGVINLDVEAVERVEAELDRIVERRAALARDTERVEELWKDSTRAHRERRQEANREAWRCFYLEQAERLERTAAELAASHRARAAMLGAVS
jgi:Mg-chelatase subunit ChlI